MSYVKSQKVEKSSILYFLTICCHILARVRYGFDAQFGWLSQILFGSTIEICMDEVQNFIGKVLAHTSPICLWSIVAELNNQKGVKKMAGGYISFFNGSSAFSDGDLQAALPDFQAQLDNEFKFYWGMDAYLDIGGGGMPITIVDYPGANDPAGALGYHYIDGNYNPYAVIFAALARDNGYSISGVISHEMLEMLADQLIDTCALYDRGDGTGVIVLQEVCDPCEANLYYEGAVNNTVVSDFVTPAWYVPGDPNQVDYLSVIGGPWQLASGGYVSYETVTLSGWQQATADTVQQVAGQIQKRIASANPRGDIVQQVRLKHLRSQADGAATQAGLLGHMPRRVQRPGDGRQAQAQGRQPQTRHQVPTGPRIQAMGSGSQIRIIKRAQVPDIAGAGERAAQAGIHDQSALA